jgi:hypothetical protein
MTDSDLDTARVRAGRNQAMFREVNERIGELSKQWASAPQFVCECENTRCAETLTVSVEEYERVRSDPGCFFVALGHEVGEVEETVSSTDHYAVVRKLGAGLAVAVRLDPRRDGELEPSAWLP